MYRNIKYLAVVLFSFMLLAGCGPEEVEKVTGRVAIIDLGKIAADIGRDKSMDNKVSIFVKSQQDLITKLRDDFKNKLAEEEKKMGKKPKKKDKEKYAQMTQQAEFKLRQEISLAERDAVQLRTRLALEFRKEIEPIAIKVATADGFSVVFIKQPAMLYIETSVDISGKVIAAMRGSQSASK